MSEIRYTGSKPEFVDGIISDDSILLKELNSSPSSENLIGKIYAKSDKKLYFKNSLDSETQITTSDVTLPNNYFNSSVPYYYDPSGRFVSTSAAVSNLVAKTSNNSQNIILSPTNSSEVSYQWLFNEEMGSVANEASSNSFIPINISGTPSWGTGYVGINGAVAANSFTTPTGTLSQLGSFSIGIWVSFPTVTASRWYFNLTNGLGNNPSNYSLAFGFDVNAKLSCTISNGTPTATNLITTKTVPSNTKIFLVLTYNRIGAGTSVASAAWTADGVSWDKVSSSSAVLMQQNPTFSLKSRLDATGATGINTNYHRLVIYDNYILNETEIQKLYDLGSEASASSYRIPRVIPIIADINNSPRTWLFNETSGTTAFDSSGVTDLALSGTYTQTSSYLSIDGTNASNLISSSNGAFVDLGSFSTVSWVEFNTLPGASALIYGVGLNSTGNANWSWLLRNTSSSIGFQVSNGSTNSQVTTNITLLTGIKYLIVTTYQRVSAGTSVGTVSVTPNGVDWYKASLSTMILMQQNTGHPLRSNRAADSLPGNNIRYHRVEIYNNKILSDTEIQDIWNAGSEVSFTEKYSSGVNSCAVSSNLSGTISSSTTTITGTGTNFFKDFQIGDVIYSNGQGRRITAITSNTSLTIESSFPLNLSSRTYRRGGLAPNTWYYLYAIGNGTSSSLIWSTRDVSRSDTLVDLPTNYSYRQTTYIVETDSLGLLYNTQIIKGWPTLPTFHYKQSLPNILTNGAATVNTTISASSMMPPNSTRGEFTHTRGGTTASNFTLGSGTTEYTTTRIPTSSALSGANTVLFITDNSQNFYYRVDNATNTLSLAPYSYTITSNIL